MNVIKFNPAPLRNPNSVNYGCVKAPPSIFELLGRFCRILLSQGESGICGSRAIALVYNITRYNLCYEYSFAFNVLFILNVTARNVAESKALSL